MWAEGEWPRGRTIHSQYASWEGDSGFLAGTSPLGTNCFGHRELAAGLLCSVGGQAGVWPAQEAGAPPRGQIPRLGPVPGWLRAGCSLPARMQAATSPDSHATWVQEK